MATRRSKAAQKFRGAQKWIMAEIGALRPSESLSTAQITKRIKKASGKDFHKNSVYLALRKLVDRGSIQSVRVGQEKTYKVAKSGGSIAAAPVEAPSPSPSASVVRTPASAVETPAVTVPQATALPHKLALGEILVLEVTDGQVLTATNLHGQLVMEWHSVP